eukprot:3002362-Amphidinium_carterae.1
MKYETDRKYIRRGTTSSNGTNAVRRLALSVVDVFIVGRGGGNMQIFLAFIDTRSGQRGI